MLFGKASPAYKEKYPEKLYVEDKAGQLYVYDFEEDRKKIFHDPPGEFTEKLILNPITEAVKPVPESMEYVQLFFKLEWIAHAKTNFQVVNCMKWLNKNIGCSKIKINCHGGVNGKMYMPIGEDLNLIDDTYSDKAIDHGIDAEKMADWLSANCLQGPKIVEPAGSVPRVVSGADRQKWVDEGKGKEIRGALTGVINIGLWCCYGAVTVSRNPNIDSDHDTVMTDSMADKLAKQLTKRGKTGIEVTGRTDETFQMNVPLFKLTGSNDLEILDIKGKVIETIKKDDGLVRDPVTKMKPPINPAIPQKIAELHQKELVRPHYKLMQNRFTNRSPYLPEMDLGEKYGIQGAKTTATIIKKRTYS
jgi:hypothetical protein